MYNFGVSYNIEVNNISIMSFLYSCIQIWWTNNSNYQNITGYNTFIHIINKQWLSTPPCISPVRQYINSISIDQYMTHLQEDLFTYILCLYTHMIKLHMIAIINAASWQVSDHLRIFSNKNYNILLTFFRIEYLLIG